MNSLASRPVFVLGNNRSGTSLLRMMLTHHPDLIIPPESHFFLWLHDRFRGWEANVGITDFIEALLGCTKIETWNLEPEALAHDLAEQRPQDYPSLISCVYLYYGKTLGRSCTRWGDKNSLWVDKLPAIIECYPEAVLLHIVRDGRDVACSYRDLAARQLASRYAPRLPANIATIAGTWSRNVMAVRAFGQSLPSGYVECRYEELIRHPERVLRKLCKALELDFHPRMVNYLEEKQHLILEPAEFMAWKAGLSKPLDRSRSGRFKALLSTEQIAEFETLAGSALLQFGYTLQELS